MAYAYLLCAILFEVLGTIAMKYSEGFTKVIPSLLIVVAYGICFVSLTIALKSLPMSLVYAIWAGVGTALMVILGQVFFEEPLTYSKALATLLIVAGVVMLNLGESAKVDDKLTRLEESDLTIKKNLDAPPRFIEEILRTENAG
jgi:small multidrug resistance pump